MKHIKQSEKNKIWLEVHQINDALVIKGIYFITATNIDDKYSLTKDYSK